jgi:hypothetical protein
MDETRRQETGKQIGTRLSPEEEKQLILINVDFKMPEAFTYILGAGN